MSASPHHRKPRAQRVRVTARDREALDLVARLRAVTLGDVAVLLGALNGRAALTIRATRMVVTRWRTLGLVTTVTNPRGGPGVVVATRDACDWVMGEVPATVGTPAWRDMPHTLSVAAVAVYLLSITPGARWVSEHELRERALTHCPDGVLVLGDGRAYAIEVERVQKSARRWRDIIAAHLTVWDGVTYYCHGSTTAALHRWVEANLPIHERGRVVVVDLGGLSR